MTESATTPDPPSRAFDPWMILKLVSTVRDVDEVVSRFEGRVTWQQVHESVAEAGELVRKAASVVEASQQRREWRYATRAAERYAQRTEQPLSTELIKFALSIFGQRPYRYVGPGQIEAPAPPGAPPLQDWSVWAHRVLDMPLVWRTSPDRRGRSHRIYRDPWSVAMSNEHDDQLDQARRWDAQTNAWMPRLEDLDGA